MPPSLTMIAFSPSLVSGSGVAESWAGAGLGLRKEQQHGRQDSGRGHEVSHCLPELLSGAFSGNSAGPGTSAAPHASMDAGWGPWWLEVRRNRLPMRGGAGRKMGCACSRLTPGSMITQAGPGLSLLPDVKNSAKHEDSQVNRPTFPEAPLVESSHHGWGSPRLIVHFFEPDPGMFPIGSSSLRVSNNRSIREWRTRRPPDCARGRACDHSVS